MKDKWMDFSWLNNNIDAIVMNWIVVIESVDAL